MDPDLSLVIGILLAGLAVPGFLAGVVERVVLDALCPGL